MQRDTIPPRNYTFGTNYRNYIRQHVSSEVLTEIEQYERSELYWYLFEQVTEFELNFLLDMVFTFRAIAEESNCNILRKNAVLYALKAAGYQKYFCSPENYSKLAEQYKYQRYRRHVNISGILEQKCQKALTNNIAKFKLLSNKNRCDNE